MGHFWRPKSNCASHSWSLGRREGGVGRDGWKHFFSRRPRTISPSWRAVFAWRIAPGEQCATQCGAYTIIIITQREYRVATYLLETRNFNDATRVITRASAADTLKQRRRKWIVVTNNKRWLFASCIPHLANLIWTLWCHDIAKHSLQSMIAVARVDFERLLLWNAAR
jgi:hypothetical protein